MKNMLGLNSGQLTTLGIFITFKTLKHMLPKKKNSKMSFLFFNSGSTSRSVLAFNTANSEILVNYKVLDL